MTPRSGRSRAGRSPSATLAAGVVACLFAGELAGVHAQAPGSPPAADHVPNEVIVRLRDGSSGAELMELFSRLGAIGITAFESVDGLYVLRLPAGLDVQTAERTAKQLDSVAYAEPNYIVTTGASLPNDPSFGDLWGLNNTGQSGGTADADIDAPEAWDITTGSSGVVVVVIDTGIDYTHPDLVANMFRNETDCNTNGVDDDGNGYADDCYGIDTVNNDSDPLDDHSHGTHTAGTIGATGNNGVGVVGVNWQVKLMPCKFLAATGSGSTAAAITCLEYAAMMKDRGVNIVATSNSWGGGGYSQALHDAIDAQRQRGILFVAAAGNEASDNDATPNYPANIDLPNVIAVAATTRTDVRSSFSNYGRRTVDVGAPGSSILSTTINNTYSVLSGTSMATPHVAGVAALLKSQDPTRDWRAIRNLILAGGDVTPALAGTTVTGRRLNAYGSLTCNGATVFSRAAPIADVVTTVMGTSVTVSAINIGCAAGLGNVAVALSGGGTLTLLDNGVAPDQQAGDGSYAAAFLPAAAGSQVLTFPDNSTLTVQVLSSAAYAVQATPYAYRTISGSSLGLGDDTSAALATPFPINFGGVNFNTLYVSSNGTVNVSGTNNAWDNASLPTTKASTLIAVFWDDLVGGTSAGANAFWDTLGTAPNRELVIEWRNLPGYLLTSACPGTESATFQVVFFEGKSQVIFNYADATFGGSCSFRDAGLSATVGIQTAAGVARQFSFNAASLPDGSALRWTLPGSPGSPFTDDTLTAGVTIVKAVHIAELRTRIDGQRTRFGLGPVAWTDPAMVAGVTAAKGTHLAELRAAVIAAYEAAGLAAPVFTEPAVQAGLTMVRATHIAELRNAVLALEAR